MTAFIVQIDADCTQAFTDGWTYAVLDSGVLKLERDGGSPIHLAAGAWRAVCEINPAELFTNVPDPAGALHGFDRDIVKTCG